MVGNNGTMMAIRIVHSKLRKREEHSASVHPAEAVLQTAPQATPEPLAFRQQPLWQFPPPLPPPYVYPHDQVSKNLTTILFLSKTRNFSNLNVFNNRPVDTNNISQVYF